MKVGDFFIALGFDVDDKKLKDFKDNIAAGTKGLAAMGAAAAATVYGIKQFIASSVDSSVRLNNLAQQTGIATDEVERFYNVAGRLNTEVTLDDTINAFQQLSDVIADAKLGKGPLGEAAMLGINNIGAMEPLQVIEQLRKNFRDNVGAWGQGDERVVINLMKAIGLGPEFIQAIKATDAEYNRLWQNPILGEAYRARLMQAAQAQKEFSFQWALLKGKLSEKVSPVYNEFLTNLIAVMEKAFEVSGKLTDAFGKLPTYIKSLGVAFGAAAVGLAAFASPWIAIATAAGVLLAAINDIGKYIRGEASVTGAGVDFVSGAFESIKKRISEELAKTPEQQAREREELLRGSAGGASSLIGPQSSVQNNNVFNVYTTADANETARSVMSEFDRRAMRTAQINQLAQASGMQG